MSFPHKERENHPNWKGGKYVSKKGYVIVNIGKGKQVAEHILVMEKHLGRKLKKGEIVHHKDETFEGKSKNDISNLQLTTRPDHASHHHKGKGKGFCVTFNSWTGKWKLEIGSRKDRKQFGLGVCETKEKALLVAYDKYGYILDKLKRRD